MRRSLSTLLFLLVVHVLPPRAGAYLEGDFDTAYCWTTPPGSEVTTLTACPPAVRLEWTRPPPETMLERVPESVSYRVELDPSLGVASVVHANVHSCDFEIGSSCSPQVRENGDLVTHTEAQEGDLLPAADGAADAAEFVSDLTLLAGRWIVIAHVRYVAGGVQYDTAVGLHRTVDAAASTDALLRVSLATLGGLVLVALGLAFVRRWRRRDHIDAEEERETLSSRLRRRLRTEFALVCFRTVWLAAEIALDTLTLLDIVRMPERDRGGILAPYTVAFVVGTVVAVAVSGANLILLRQLYYHYKGAGEAKAQHEPWRRRSRAKSADRPLDAYDDEAQLEASKRTLRQIYTTLVLLVLVDLPPLAITMRLLWRVADLGKYPAISASVTFGLVSVGYRASKAPRALELRDGRRELRERMRAAHTFERARQGGGAFSPAAKTVHRQASPPPLSATLPPPGSPTPLDLLRRHRTGLAPPGAAAAEEVGGTAAGGGEDDDVEVVLEL